MPPGRRREARPSHVEDGGKVRVALWRGSGAAPGASASEGPRSAAERAWEPAGTAQRDWAGVVGEAALVPPEACEETSQDRAEECAGHAGDEQPGPSLARAVRELAAGAPPCTAADAAEAAEALEAALLLLYQGDRALVRAAAWSRRGPALRARGLRGVWRARARSSCAPGRQVGLNFSAAAAALELGAEVLEVGPQLRPARAPATNRAVPRAAVAVRGLTSRARAGERRVAELL